MHSNTWSAAHRPRTAFRIHHLLIEHLKWLVCLICWPVSNCHAVFSIIWFVIVPNVWFHHHHSTQTANRTPNWTHLWKIKMEFIISMLQMCSLIPILTELNTFREVLWLKFTCFSMLRHDWSRPHHPNPWHYRLYSFFTRLFTFFSKKKIGNNRLKHRQNIQTIVLITAARVEMSNSWT